MRANTLMFAASQAKFSRSIQENTFCMSSPYVSDSIFKVNTLTDARISSKNVRSNRSRLFRSLLVTGAVTDFENSLGGDVFYTVVLQ